MAMATTARSLASKFTRPSPVVNSAFQVSRRTMASGGHDDIHRVNWWQAPLKPMTWKEHQIVLGVFTGWGVAIYGGIKAFKAFKSKS